MTKFLKWCKIELVALKGGGNCRRIQNFLGVYPLFYFCYSKLMEKLIIGNWKCNPTSLNEAKKLFNLAKRGIKKIKNVEVVICPPFSYLSLISSFLVPRSSFKLGAQNCFWEEKGAFTGEISPLMLKDLGCKYVIVGHSERRTLGETDEIINKKLKAVLKAKLTPILCIGETLKERKKGKTFKVLKTQLEKGLKNIRPFLVPRSSFIIAYEPVWAIGTGKPCGIEEAREARLFIKSTVKSIPILYGGSVTSKNGKDYVKEADFDGLLVGGASLEAKEFVKIIKSISNS